MRAAVSLPFGSAIKRLMPRGLLGRTLLIMLVPLVVVQAIALQMFYGNHLGVVSRRLSGAIAGEIYYTVELLRQFHSPADREWVLDLARRQFNLGIKLEPGANWKHAKLRLSGIGTMRARGEARTPGQVVCSDVMRKADGWHLSLVLACEPHREFDPRAFH